MLRRAGTRSLVRFGGYYTLSSLMFYMTTNVDNILIGRFLKEDALGLYSQAFNLMMKPVNVVIAPLTGVMLPALARAAGEPRRYAELLLGFFRWIALVMFPIGVGLIIVADDAMQVLGGSRWSGAGPLLTALGVSVLVQGFFNVLGSVLASVGRAKHLFYASAAIAATLGAAFCVGLWAGLRAGAPTLGVAASYSAAMVLLVFPPYLVFCLRTVGISARTWLAQLLPAALAAVGMGLMVALCHALLVPPRAVPVLARLAAEIAVGVVVYAILARREIRWFLSLGRT
jgi:PST family polysaccharide transporter